MSSKTQSIFHDVKAVRGSNTPKAESSVSSTGPLTAGVPVLGTSMYTLFSYLHTYSDWRVISSSKEAVLS